ncbi:MAG: FHA domain-containing protein [Propionivibrio sp.]|nr:FHA domain-containing protein [Propionivibrio sp.]
MESNTIPFDQNGISHRHAVIVNYPNDVWIYDLGSLAGISVNGNPVHGKAFLDGVHTVDNGSRKIWKATEESLLI